MSSRKHRSHILWLLAASLVALQWIVLRLSGVHSSPVGAILSGVGIFGAAVLLSWAAEAAGRWTSRRAWRLAFLAGSPSSSTRPRHCISPGRRGRDPSYTQYATAT